MPNSTLKVRFESFDGGERSLVLSPTELLEQYFHGISICTADGRELSQDAIREKILSAQAEVEQLLSIKLFKKSYTEKRDFILDQWKQWGYLQMTFPVRDILQMNGWLGGINQVEYPIEWVSNNSPEDERYFWRNIHLVPSGASVEFGTNSVIAVGITPHAGFLGLANIPNYWSVKYVTGFNKVPADIADVIGKLASMQVFAILGDILLGAGIASQSLSYDGLSESITTTQSAENSAFSARIRQYSGELKKKIPELVDFYVGIKFMSL